MFLGTINQQIIGWIESLTSYISRHQLSNIEISLLTSGLILLTLAFGIIGYILIRRVYINQNQIQSEKLIALYQSLLIAYISANKRERESLMPEFRASDSNILLAQMLIMKKNFKGAEGLALDNLYLELGYKKLFANKLQSLSWLTRLEGLEEHTQMNVHISKDILHKLVCDSKKMVRIAALKYEILRGRNWQTLLVEYRYPLTKWEQIQICEMIYKKPNFNFQECMALKASSNPSVAVLYDMLEQPFTQLESSDLVPLYDDKLLIINNLSN